MATSVGVAISIDPALVSFKPMTNPGSLKILDYKPHIKLPFSAHLRIAALQRGYDLISSKSTPYPLLCKGFRFCIFTSTRDQITQHMRELLRESSADTAGTFSNKDVKDTASPLPKPPALSASAKISDDGEWCTTGGAGEPNSHLLDASAEYIDAEAVQQFLVGKGINLKLGIDSLIVPNSFIAGSEAGETLFGELFGGRKVTLSTNKLVYGKKDLRMLD